jgi:hypothetical protein
MTIDEPSPTTIDIDANIEAEGQLIVGDQNVQNLAESAVAQGLNALATAPDALRCLALKLLPLGEAQRALGTGAVAAPLATSIRIRGSVRAQNVVIGSGNVQVVPAAISDALRRLSIADRVDLIRRLAPSDELLESAERLGRLPTTYRDFERNVSPRRPELAPTMWRRKLAALERVVGLLEIGQTSGTCFLVGANLILTNYHVVRALIDGRRSTGARVRFDYHEQGELDEAGTSYGLAQHDWCIDYSPYSELDAVGEISPRADELDYALLRLAEPALTGSGSPRGWLSLTAAQAPQVRDPLLILQHPRGQHLKLCFGQVTSGGASRIRYDTNTDGGSSGSPCLNDSLELVALHHMGDPNFAKAHAPAFNQGIPIHLIAERLRGKGLLPPP